MFSTVVFSRGTCNMVNSERLHDVMQSVAVDGPASRLSDQQDRSTVACYQVSDTHCSNQRSCQAATLPICYSPTRCLNIRAAWE